MSWIFKPEPAAPPDPRTTRRRALLLSLPFALMGLFALVLLLHDGLRGGLSKEKAIQLLSVIIVSAGFPLLIFGINAKKNALRAGRAPLPAEEKPWRQRPDWAAGRIRSSGMADARSLIIMGSAFCVIGGLIAFLVIPSQWRSGNRLALFALFFPLAGIAFLTMVVRNLRAHRYYGEGVFEMTATPGTPGGMLEGVIRMSEPLKFEHGLRLRLACLQRTVTGQGNTEQLLWQGEKFFKPGAGLPETGSGQGGIPVCFQLPADQPESSLRGKKTVVWRLEARAKMAGPVFFMKFDVPVFKSTGA